MSKFLCIQIQFGRFSCLSRLTLDSVHFGSCDKSEFATLESLSMREQDWGLFHLIEQDLQFILIFFLERCCNGFGQFDNVNPIVPEVLLKLLPKFLVVSLQITEMRLNDSSQIFRFHNSAVSAFCSFSGSPSCFSSSICSCG